MPPNADAGADQHALVGATVCIDGQGSHDPDNGPEALTFRWSFTSTPPDSDLDDAAIVGATQAQTSFVPDVAGSSGLQLLVCDGQGNRDDTSEDDDNDDSLVCDERCSATDDLVITVAVPHVTPNARAGADQTLLLHAEVGLDGTASEDPDSGPQAVSCVAHRTRELKPAGSITGQHKGALQICAAQVDIP